MVNDGQQLFLGGHPGFPAKGFQHSVYGQIGYFGEQGEERQGRQGRSNRVILHID